MEGLYRPNFKTSGSIEQHGNKRRLHVEDAGKKLEALRSLDDNDDARMQGVDPT